MKINIIRTEGGWIIGNITNRYAKMLPNCTIHQIGYRGNAGDINLYITYSAYRGPTNGIDIGWFTHKENHTFDSIAGNVDYCIAMSNKTADLLPKEKTIVIPPGIDEMFNKQELVIGCVGRNYPSNRKKFTWINELNKINGVQIRFTNGKVPPQDMPKSYNSIDYLLILSDNEGGPMPVLEAMACGKPIIAPDVGWAWDTPCIQYTGIDDLKSKIESLIIPKNTWEISADKMIKLCNRLYNTTTA